MTFSTAEIVEKISENSPAVAYDLVNPVTEVMLMARQTCDGDLDRALVMLIVTLRSSGHPEFRSLSPEEIAGGEALPSYGTNIQSLADSTGIPRETVRRKVNELIDKGWVSRRGNALSYTVAGYAAVKPTRDAIIAMHAQGYGVVHSLLGADGSAALNRAPPAATPASGCETR
ncbi:MAG TPA: hypothetical protein VD929_02050 [Caulobacteraceae bacterium]|nr:hypothetical protein [Caulobacteraceae bacterium]